MEGDVADVRFVGIVGLAALHRRAVHVDANLATCRGGNVHHPGRLEKLGAAGDRIVVHDADRTEPRFGGLDRDHRRRIWTERVGRVHVVVDLLGLDHALLAALAQCANGCEALFNRCGIQIFIAHGFNLWFRDE